MRKLLAGCLALCIPALLTAQTPADSISRTEAIDSVVVTARRPLMVYKQTGNIAVDIEQLKYAPLFAGEKDIFKFLQLLPGVSAGKDGMSGQRPNINSLRRRTDLQSGACLRHPLDFQRRNGPIGRGVERLHITRLRVPAFGLDADSHTRGRPTESPPVAHGGNLVVGRDPRRAYQTR